MANVILSLAGLTAGRSETLLRKLRTTLDERVEIDVADPENERILVYLIGKQLIGARPRRTGRYSKYMLEHEGADWKASTSKGEPVTHLPVFITDIWFSDERLRSTVGLPTPDNSEEAFEFCTGIGVISKARAARTSEGQLVSVLRGLSPDASNPFVLGLESSALLRQIVTHDALVLYELARQLASGEESFRRDELIPTGFVEIATRAADTARDLGMRPDQVAQVKGFLRLIESTIGRKAGRAVARQRTVQRGKSKHTADGPGVLEHRLSPRLEWLTDFGMLVKDGPKNAFAYRRTPTLSQLADRLGEYLRRERTADDLALGLSAQDTRWQSLRAHRQVDSFEDALRAGYRTIQMSIGPVPIREVCFIAALHLDPIPPVADLREQLLRWSEREPGIRLAGGRYRREPELVYISEKVIR